MGVPTSTNTDIATNPTVFGQMDVIQKFAKTSNSSASAALGVANNIQSDLGVFGQNVNVNDKLKQLEDYIKDIQNAAIALGPKQDATGTLAQQLVEMVRQLLNEQARQAGLAPTGMMIEELSKQQAKDAEKVSDKLEEINVKVRALQEAMKIDDVVVKTWFENEE
jgi:hypothetical protein